MNFFTQKEVIDFIKFYNKEWAWELNQELRLKNKNKTLLIINSSKKEKYNFFIINNKNEKIYNEKGNNYNLVLEKLVKELLKRKLLSKEKTVSIISTIEDWKEEVEAFSFDNIILEETLKNWIDLIEIKEKEIENFIWDWMNKILIRDEKMILEKRSWEKLERKYIKSSIILFLIKEIELLINLKKNKKIATINKEIVVRYKTWKIQNLNIVENQDDLNLDDWEAGFVDNNLVNDVFTVCSLSELTVNKNALKIWLNKILIKDKMLWIYF